MEEVKKPARKRARKRTAKSSQIEMVLGAVQGVLTAGLSAYKVLQPMIEKRKKGKTAGPKKV